MYVYHLTTTGTRNFLILNPSVCLPLDNDWNPEFSYPKSQCMSTTRQQMEPGIFLSLIPVYVYHKITTGTRDFLILSPSVCLPLYNVWNPGFSYSYPSVCPPLDNDWNPGFFYPNPSVCPPLDNDWNPRFSYTKSQCMSTTRTRLEP